MTNASLHGSRRRLLYVGAGLLVLTVLLSGFEQFAPAQPGGKKTDPGKKPDDKKTDPGKKAPPLETKKVHRLLADEKGAEQVAYINYEIRQKWEENKITPAPECTDYEFIRRASLDIIGRIAKVSEIDQFMKDPPEKRRSLLIKRLLDSDEYANHFANIWTVLLMTRSGAINPGTKPYHDQMHLWLTEQFEKPDMGFDKVVTELLAAQGFTNDREASKTNPAVNFILTHLGEKIKENPQANGKYEMVPVTSRTTKLFLGLRTQCTQCHDHPFNEEWRQEHFWGINAFFRQVDAPKGRPMGMQKMPANNNLQLVDDPNLNQEGLVSYERRTGLLKYTRPTFLDGQKMPSGAKNRREELAKFVVKSPYFAKAFVNRMWGHFLGRGFTKDVDDFGDHNPVSHPELLDKLAEDVAKRYNHNPRDLITWICNSEAYNLSSVANPSNEKPEAEQYFGRVLLKSMTPEQLFESLMVATQAQVAKTKESKKDLRQKWLSKLIINFGDDEGNEATFNGTVVQALLLMNGEDINNAIMDKENGTVAVVLKNRSKLGLGGARAAMADLYLAALNRPPTPTEYQRVLSPKMMNFNHPSVPNRHDAAFFNAFYQDIFWALLNSNEFILNH
jgi:hypothetical protein